MSIFLKEFSHRLSSGLKIRIFQLLFFPRLSLQDRLRQGNISKQLESEMNRTLIKWWSLKSLSLSDDRDQRSRDSDRDSAAVERSGALPSLPSLPSVSAPISLDALNKIKYEVINGWTLRTQPFVSVVYYAIHFARRLKRLKLCPKVTIISKN